MRNVMKKRSYIRALATVCALVVMLLTEAVFAAAAMPDFYKDPSINPSRFYQGGEFGDTVDPFTGQLSIVHTDLSIPGNGGLPINVTRWYSTFKGIGPLGGWQMHAGVLGFDALFDKACAFRDKGRYHAKPVLWLPGGKVIQFFPTASPSAGNPSARLMSVDRWTLTCSGTNEVYVASPDGVIYWMVKYDQSDAHGRWYSTRKITDKNGNWLTFNYISRSGYWSGNSWQINEINANDNRKVSFNWDDDFLKAVTYYNQGNVASVVGYEYKDIGGRTCLSKVNLPENQAWQFTSHNSSTYGCLVKGVTHPLGGKVTYGHNGDLLVDQRKLDDNPWTFFSYSKSSTSDRTKITNPDGSAVVHNFWGRQSTSSGTRYRIGLPQNVAFFDAGVNTDSGTATKNTIYTLAPQTIGYQAQLVNQGETRERDPSVYAPLVTKIQVILDGSTYTTEYSNHDSYGNPRSINETGNAGTRLSSLAYDVKTDKWLLHLLDTTYVSGTQGNVDHTYDANGNLLSVTKHGVTTSYSYYGNGNLNTVTAPGGKTTTYADYKFGIAQTEYQPESVTVSRVIDEFGRVISEADGRGYSTGYNYDGLNRLTYIDNPKAGSADVSVSYSGSIQTVTRGNYQQITTTDGLGRVIATVARDTALNRHTGEALGYDNMGRLKYRSLPDTTTCSGLMCTGLYGGYNYTYDVLGRVKRVSFSHDASIYTESTYLSGNRVRVRDERGHITTYTYAAYGNPDERHLVRIDAPEGVTTEIARNKLGLITNVTQGGLTRSYEYHSNYYLKLIRDPETGVTIFGRDDAGNMTSRQVGSSPVTYFDYDGRNRNWRIRYPDGTASFTFNKNDQVESSIFNGAARAYRYDENGNLKWESLTIDGRNFELDYGINALDQVNTLTYPADKAGMRRTVSYNPDALGRETQASGYASNIQFHPNGTLSQITYGNGVVSSLGLNERQLPKNFMVGYGSILNMEYGYDTAGNLDYVTDHRSSLHDLDLGYDGLSRLNYATGNWGSTSIGYDRSGNITNLTAGANSLSYSYSNNGTMGSNNRLVAVNGYQNLNFQYDTYGNITNDGNSAFRYNHAGQLTQITGKARAQYSYDAGNIRVKKSANGATRYYFYNAAGNLLGEYRQDGMLLNEYIYAAGKQIARIGGDRLAVLPLDLGDDFMFTLPIFSANANRVTYYHSDHLGSPIAATDAQGKVLWYEAYQPYGLRQKNSTDPSKTPIAYTGKPEDTESGLVYMNARYYHPAIGRFMAVDSVGYVEGNVHSFNRYAYANNNPYKFVDPDGRFPIVPMLIGGSINTTAAFLSGKRGFNELGHAFLTGGLMGLVPGIGAAGGMATRQIFGLNLMSAAATTFVNDVGNNLRTHDNPFVNYGISVGASALFSWAGGVGAASVATITDEIFYNLGLTYGTDAAFNPKSIFTSPHGSTVPLHYPSGYLRLSDPSAHVYNDQTGDYMGSYTYDPQGYTNSDQPGWGDYPYSNGSPSF